MEKSKAGGRTGRSGWLWGLAFYLGWSESAWLATGALNSQWLGPITNAHFLVRSCDEVLIYTREVGKHTG